MKMSGVSTDTVESGSAFHSVKMMRSMGGGAAAGGAGMMGRGGGRGGGQSAAQLLLQKASTQLRGERVPIKPREEDELASYLNSLTQKTAHQAKSVNYEEYGDISISSGADAMTPRVGRTPSPAIGAGSKFLKKKTPAAAEATEPEKKAKSGGVYGLKAKSALLSHLADDDDDDDDDDDETAYVGARGVMSAQKPGPKFASTSAPTSARRGGFQTSSALNKASALANKITQRSSGSNPFRKSRSTLLDSDTDESLGAGARGSNLRGKSSRPASTSDNSVGHDGNKFMKKRGGEATEVKSEDVVRGSGRQSPARKAAKEKPAEKKTESRGSGQRGGGTLVHGTTNVYLTSEEESLADFIQGLSGSDESRRSAQKAKQIVPRAKRQATKSPSSSPSPHRRSRQSSPSPTPPLKMRGRSGSKHVFHRVSSQDSDTITSDVAESHDKIVIANSISLAEPLEINLMDANTLGPIVLNTPEPASYSEATRKSAKIRSSPFKKSHSPSPSLKKKKKGKSAKAGKKSKEKKSSSIFESLGIQSVEDLLGGASDKENSEESEIPTEPIFPKKRAHDQSTSQIVTEFHSRGTPQRQVSYSEDFEASISERIGEEKNKGRWARKVSASSIATQYSDEETGVDYTEDFPSETLSMAKYSETDRSSHYRYSDEETEASETISESPRGRGGMGKRGEKKVVVETHSVEIQTAAPAGLHYQWLSQTGVSVMGPSLGLGSVDPTPIAATVINPDALEALTAYSPATLAIHDMLKQQVELIKQFAQAHERLYHALSDSNVPDYKYTTLEGTKAFIRKHRKPRLTMKQALKMVEQEMGR